MMMKKTGMIRKVDELGRIVVPMELRRSLGIAERDLMEIYVAGDSIILRRCEPACVFCQAHDDLLPFKRSHICRTCFQELSESQN